MLKRFSFIASWAFAFCALLSCGQNPQADYASFVDVRIGSGGHGHVFVGASVPFGMVQLGPSSIPTDWDWCSGYHSSDSTVIGFSHTHLSGTGVGDLEDVTIMPVMGKNLTYARGNAADPSSGLWSYADRTTEIAEPGFYSVRLERYPVLSEMTATKHVGLTRFTFPKDAQDAAIVFDLENGLNDKVLDASIQALDETHITGWRHSKGWADNQKLWFVAEFSKPFTLMTQHGTDGLYYRLDFKDPQDVMVKVALSPSSVEAAQRNLEAELEGWDFASVRRQARQDWNKELSKVDVTTQDATSKTIFYTALYHTMISPALFSDVDEAPRYTTLSLWDTYRAQMPLFTILHPEKEDDMMNTFLEIFEKEGKLPVWHLMGCETWCMVGNPGISVLADAVSKGFKGFDVEKAYEAMKVSAMREDRGQGLRMQYGYIPSELFNQSVAYEMEYAVADWALAQVALQLGHQKDYEYFLERSHSWRRHFDPETGFVRGVMSDGSFREPFNPYHSDHSYDDYTEGNAWQYTWLAPHDVQGLEQCFGSRERMIAALDSLFLADSRLEGENVSADISGLIGQYAHGNEPSHHTVYLYSMAGARDKTADLVRQICSELYFADENGLSGNEDAGQMSAWYVLSAMGFYQAEPSGGKYYFGSPLFDKVTLNLTGGKTFEVIAEDNSEENRYIESITLNGLPYDKPYIDYQDIMNGGTLVLKMRP